MSTNVIGRSGGTNPAAPQFDIQANSWMDKDEIIDRENTEGKDRLYRYPNDIKEIHLDIKKKEVCAEIYGSEADFGAQHAMSFPHQLDSALRVMSTLNGIRVPGNIPMDKTQARRLAVLGRIRFAGIAMKNANYSFKTHNSDRSDVSCVQRLFGMDTIANTSMEWIHANDTVMLDIYQVTPQGQPKHRPVISGKDTDKILFCTRPMQKDCVDELDILAGVARNMLTGTDKHEDHLYTSFSDVYRAVSGNSQDIRKNNNQRHFNNDNAALTQSVSHFAFQLLSAFLRAQSGDNIKALSGAMTKLAGLTAGGDEQEYNDTMDEMLEDLFNNNLHHDQSDPVQRAVTENTCCLAAMSGASEDMFDRTPQFKLYNYLEETGIDSGVLNEDFPGVQHTAPAWNLMGVYAHPSSVHEANANHAVRESHRQLMCIQKALIRNTMNRTIGIAMSSAAPGEDFDIIVKRH